MQNFEIVSITSSQGVICVFCSPIKPIKHEVTLNMRLYQKSLPMKTRSMMRPPQFSGLLPDISS